MNAEQQGELQIVLGRAEETAAAREVGAVDEGLLTARFEAAVDARVKGREARMAPGRKEKRVVHAERPEDALFGEFAEGQARCHFDCTRQRVETE